MEETPELKDIKHHKQLELCTTRAAYRQGKQLTAVKVYTVISESQHLFIYGVPKISLRSELKALCNKYGILLNIHAVSDYKTEIFTECYHVQFDRIQSARIAKRLIDNKSFFGSILHVCYAPEYESVDETRSKFAVRSKDVLRRINGEVSFVSEKSTYKPQDRKRKNPALPLTKERLANMDPMMVWMDVPKEIDPREPQNKIPKMSEPNKHFLIPRAPYGPHRKEFGDNVDMQVDNLIMEQPNIIPTQVVQSREYKFNNIEKKIVFRNK